VVDALARYPLRVNLPWDPLGRPPRATSKAGPPERATLKDVHRVFASDDAIAKIYGKASAPLTRAAARALLDGERHPHEDAAEYERWWSVWSEGIRPPAVLLDGETGVGKTLMAEFLTFLLTPTRTDGAEQGLSSRARFVKMNGAGLRVADFSHQWMGVAPGIWSGIDDAVVGRLARAAHGVAFIDELGDMPQDVQAAVLTFLDSREIQPGGIEPFLGYQHIIAATNKELADEVASGAFRQDLLARFPLRLRIPPLRERPIEERERWVDFLAQDPVVNPRLDDGQYEVTHLDRGALDRLIEHDYTNGNFRELTERVHESLRRARRHLRRVVTSDDVPPPEQAIARSMTAGAER
jgi:transcriptional regulator with AAA-type ATPase domain